MKHVLFATFWSICLHAIGQSFDYGNTWYKARPDRPYLKLVLSEEGVYRVDADALTQAGFDLQYRPLAQLLLLYRGEEVPLFLTTGADGALDFLEFYGRMNDGALDALMYRDPNTDVYAPDLQPNARYSLFTDVSAYFLTWGEQPGRRWVQVAYSPPVNLSPEPYLPYTALADYPPGRAGTQYLISGGPTYSSLHSLNSDYVPGEGYIGPDFNREGPRLIRINTPLQADSGNPVIFRTRIFNRSSGSHHVAVYPDGSGSAILDTAGITGVFIRSYERQVPLKLKERTELTYRAISAPASTTDNNHICWASLTYDRLPDMAGDSTLRITRWSGNTATFWEIGNVGGQDSVWAYDLANGRRIAGRIDPGSRQAQLVIPGNRVPGDILVVTDRGILRPAIQVPRLSRLHDPQRGAEFVIIAHPDLAASAEAYAQYRDTARVNPLSAKVVYTDEIYDEYGYGSITPWAIKRFCKDALDNWAVKPRFFLLWGKGKYRTRNEEDLRVPTFGYPATDYEFVSHFDLNSPRLLPEAAIGRVNVYTNEQGWAYLEKVNAYEHSPWQPWMKEATFLGGGKDTWEQNTISSAFRYFRGRLEEAPYGGEIHYFQKNSASTVIDPATADYHDEIGQGVGIIHFFGHSSVNIQDISIREANEYNNFGRFPLMVAMGCYGGDFTGSTSYGERWLLAQNRGAIGYLANSSAGFINNLSDYGRVLYDVMFEELAGAPLGEITRRCLEVYGDSQRGKTAANHARQMNLQGDPAIVLYYPEKADYAIEESGIAFSPNPFSALDDSFQVNVRIQNLARVEEDSITLRITQRLEGGQVILHPRVRLGPVLLADTVSVVLKNTLGSQIAGENIFEIWVDADNEVEEYDESNNRVSLSLVVPGNLAATLYPPPFGVVGESRISLRASTFSMTRDDQVGFVFEIDTSYLFNSPLLASSGVVRGPSPGTEWAVPFSLKDSLVYYWRVKLADATPSLWQGSSFRFLPGRTGWAQARMPQFRDTRGTGVGLDTLSGTWKYSTFGVQVEFNTRRNWYLTYLRNNELAYDMALNAYYYDAVAYLILDQYTLDPVEEAPQFENGLRSATVPSQLHQLRRDIEEMKPGDYILMGSNGNPRVPQWGEDIFTALKQVGASDNLRRLADGDPFLLLGRKGYSNSAIEVLAPNAGNVYKLDQTLLGAGAEGVLRSSRVGPARTWEAVQWRWRSLDPLLAETASLAVFGVRRDGTDSLFALYTTPGEFPLGGLDARRFPQVRLQAQVRDSVYRTPPQLVEWQVVYESVPDLVLDPVATYAFEADTLEEGAALYLELAARNAGETAFLDSIPVLLTLEQADRSLRPLDTLMLPPLAAGESTAFSYRGGAEALNVGGDSRLVVQANPDRSAPEAYYFNNTYIQEFYLEADQTDPVLDVTIDGRHIVNGDLVSPRPEILIQIDDENPRTPITDTAAVEIYFREGGIGSAFNRIFVGDPRVSFTPAQLPENKARVSFRPGLQYALPDGEYALRVQGKDQRGNRASEEDRFYEITFEVENDRTLTQVLNYPNPFSSSTRFVYTLTGEELPEIFQIHIYTLSGKQVKVIDLLALGEVRVGRHITDYAWDGTDEYGDKLGNGVYIYRTVVKFPSGYTLRTEGTDAYFNKGWGKMYLMR